MGVLRFLSWTQRKLLNFPLLNTSHPFRWLASLLSILNYIHPFGFVIFNFISWQDGLLDTLDAYIRFAWFCTLLVLSNMASYLCSLLTQACFWPFHETRKPKMIGVHTLYLQETNQQIHVSLIFHFRWYRIYIALLHTM